MQEIERTRADAVLAIIDTALDHLASLGGPRRDDRADALLLAIAGQESDWVHRVQRSRRSDGTVFAGPARGLWQFERAGGTVGVLQHHATAKLARALCVSRGVQPASRAVWEQLATDDLLAAGFARLLLWTDPHPLPEIGQMEDAWHVYRRNWRPGKPHPEKWPHVYRDALAVLARRSDTPP